MLVAPMSYVFFYVYKSVALPLSYRGKHRAVSESSSDKISRQARVLGEWVCHAHSGGGSDKRVHSRETLTRQEREHCTASCADVAELFFNALYGCKADQVSSPNDGVAVALGHRFQQLPCSLVKPVSF